MKSNFNYATLLIFLVAIGCDSKMSDKTTKPADDARVLDIKNDAASEIVKEDKISGNQRFSKSSNDEKIMTSVEAGLNHWFGVIEIPYGRISQQMLKNESKNIYNSSKDNTDKLKNFFTHYSNLGLIKFNVVDQQKEHDEKHKDVAYLKPILVITGNKYDVQITKHAYNNLIKEMTTPYKIYVKNASFKVSKIIKNNNYKCMMLPESDDFRLIVGTADMHPNHSILRDKGLVTETCKFRAILHVNSFTGEIKPVAVDIGDPKQSEWFSNHIPNKKYGSPYELDTIVEPVPESAIP